MATGHDSYGAVDKRIDKLGDCYGALDRALAHVSRLLWSTRGSDPIGFWTAMEHSIERSLAFYDCYGALESRSRAIFDCYRALASANARDHHCLWSSRSLCAHDRDCSRAVTVIARHSRDL